MLSNPFHDPNDRFSYEQWMNDLGANEQSCRSVLASMQDRCDCCGRFTNIRGPGVSWAQQWDYDLDGTPYLHDATVRCSPCTDKHGIKPTNCNETTAKYHGRNPLDAKEPK